MMPLHRSLAMRCPSLLAPVLFSLAACGGLPKNFDSLPLEKQIAAYERHFQNYGRPNLYARSHIAWHGWKAADLMAAYLNGKRHGLPSYEAIDIIHLVQKRGCSLKGTAAEEALYEFLAREPRDTAEHLLARTALDAIEHDLVAPGQNASPPGGPCRTGSY